MTMALSMSGRGHLEKEERVHKVYVGGGEGRAGEVAGTPGDAAPAPPRTKTSKGRYKVIAGIVECNGVRAPR